MIYEAVDEVTAALEGMLAPERREAVEGTAEVRETFKITKLVRLLGVMCLKVEWIVRATRVLSVTG